MRKNRQNNSGNWVGFLIFFILVFGSQIFPPLARWLTQLTGMPISAGMLYVGAVILGLLLPMLVGAIGTAARSQGNDGGFGGNAGAPPTMPTTTRLPQAPLPAEQLPDWIRSNKSIPPGTPPQVGKLPDWMQPNLPSGQPPRIGKPKFEPIIEPRVLALGLLGLLFFGLIFVTLIIFS